MSASQFHRRFSGERIAIGKTNAFEKLLLRTCEADTKPEIAAALDKGERAVAVVNIGLLLRKSGVGIGKTDFLGAIQ